MTRCTCRPPHSKQLHRRGVGRCLVVGCACLFAPPAAAHPKAAPPARGRVTVDEHGLVVEFQAPTPAQRVLRESQRTKLERALWRRIEAAGLPLPTLEYRFALSEGRRYRADGAYVDEKLLIEVEGGIWAADPGRHNRGSGFEEDCRKYNLAALLGWRVLRFSERLIKSGEAVELIERALGGARADGQMTLDGRKAVV